VGAVDVADRRDPISLLTTPHFPLRSGRSTGG
jgi:hypothetical protein